MPAAVRGAGYARENSSADREVVVGLVVGWIAVDCYLAIIFFEVGTGRELGDRGGCWDGRPGKKTG